MGSTTPHFKGAGSQRLNDFGTFYMHAHSMKKASNFCTVIKLCEENVYKVQAKILVT